MFLFLEGVNLYATLYDTEDLSTIRGGSMLLEALAGAANKEFGGEICDSGASRALLEFAADAAPDAQEVARFLAAAPYCHFTIAWGLGKTKKAAEAAARAYQLCNLPTVVLPVKEAAVQPCALDHTRPGTVEETGPDGNPRLLSASVVARREQGRKQRPQLFQSKNPLPPQSFEDIAPDDPALKPNVSGKIAVIVADGMGGGALRKSFGSDAAFSTAMAAFRTRLAEAIETFAEREGMIYADGKSIRSRLDVLVWGGDDMTFVVPASHALRFLAMLDTVFAQPFTEGKAAFAHRIGCVIAARKTPIRLLKKLAQSAEDLLRDADGPEGASRITVDVFESAPLPFASIEDYRRQLYGPGYVNGSDMFLLSGMAALTEALREFDDEAVDGLTMSQLFRALDTARLAGKKLCDEGGDELVEAALAEHFARVKDEAVEFAAWRKAFSAHDRSTALMLAQIAQLQPYAQPYAVLPSAGVEAAE